MNFKLEKLTRGPKRLVERFNLMVTALVWLLKVEPGRGIRIRKDTTGWIIETDMSAIAQSIGSFVPLSAIPGQTTGGIAVTPGFGGGGGGPGAPGFGQDGEGWGGTPGGDGQNGIGTDSEGNPIDLETGKPLGMQTLTVCIELPGGEKVLRKMRVFGTDPYEEGA